MHFAFLMLVVMNLVAGFHALGTLMAVGLMMLPAAAARFWACQVTTLAVTSSAIAFAAGYAGLLLSYYANLPSGPAIILVAGGVYIVSVVAGPRGSLWAGTCRAVISKPETHRRARTMYRISRRFFLLHLPRSPSPQQPHPGRPINSM